MILFLHLNISCYESHNRGRQVQNDKEVKETKVIPGMSEFEDLVEQ
jgi:hypothetical protein